MSDSDGKIKDFIVVLIINAVILYGIYSFYHS
jgi:hypothetical protein